MNTLETLFSRKSIRSYTGERMSQEDLDAILKAANAAPVGMGQYEDMHLTVITSPELLGGIDAAAGAMFGDPSRHPLYGAPTLVLVSTKVPDDAASANVPYSNAAIVAHNMSLAAVELGVGSVLIWGAVRALNGDADLVASLGLPEGLTVCCGVALGVTEETYELREIPADRIAKDVID